jgi:hypothetical protein
MDKTYRNRNIFRGSIVDAMNYSFTVTQTVIWHVNIAMSARTTIPE